MKTARSTALALIATGTLALAAPAASAATTAGAAQTVNPAISIGGLDCKTWIANSQGWGQCTGASGNRTKWILHVGCNLNPVVNTQTMYGPGTASIGCWAFPGVNDVWITDH